MADYIAKSRTNAFKLLDQAARERLGEFCERLDVEVYDEPEGRVCLISNSDHGDWPSWDFQNEDADGNPAEIDWPKVIAPLLAPGSVAIFISVGSEKMRYIDGHAFAVNSDGNVRRLSLSEIIPRAGGHGAYGTPMGTDINTDGIGG